MRLTHDEIRFDFGGAKFDLERDRDALGWIFSQFLYGEVTGIQVGHWIHHAPDLESASFLARQCVQELSHVRLVRSIFDRLGVAPQPAHRMVRFLATGFMGAGWEEHVCLEMALGEGYVLTIFYALQDTIPDAEIVRLLRIAAKQEESHVAFGEEATHRAAIDPRVRRRLLGLSWVSLLAMRRLGRGLAARADAAHPVWRHLPAFARHSEAVSELRLQRLGVLEGSVASIAPWRRAAYVTRGLASHLTAPLRPRPRRLTSTYLHDPTVARPLIARSSR